MVFTIRHRSKAMRDSRRVIKITMIYEGIIIMKVRRVKETM